MLTPESAERAACGLYAGTLPETELPAHGVRSCRVICVMFTPSPLTATFPIWDRFSACTIAFRTEGFAPGWPGFWLMKYSSGAPTAVFWNRRALFSRRRSGPESATRLAPPVRTRFAAVDSLVTRSEEHT